MKSDEIKTGAKVRWAGDFSNDPRNGEIVDVIDGWAWIKWNGEEKAKATPVAVLSGSRWTVLP